MIRLKIILSFFLLLSSVSLFAQQQLMQTTENIKYLSQKIANDYLLLYNDPLQYKYRQSLQKNIKILEEDFRIIAKNTQNDDIKNILDYLSYNKDQMQGLLEKEITRQNVQKVLDDSDALVEGVQSILETLHKHSLKGELRFHIMKLSKLYMAIHLKFDPTQNTKTLYEELRSIDKMTHNISQNLYLAWHNYKSLYDPSLFYFIPHIVTIATEDLLRSISEQ